MLDVPNSDPQALRAGPIAVRFVGPFSLLRCDGVPHYADAPESRSSGIYLQGVPLADRFCVSYVGETGTSFIRRLGPENSSWLAGKDRRRSQTGELDDVAYVEGRRNYATFWDNDAVTAAQRDRVLRATRVFLAPLLLDSTERRAVEAQLIRLIKMHALDRRFLYNDFSNRTLSRPLEIRLPPGVTVAGL